MTAELPVFIDTNILVYAYDVSEGWKHNQAREFLLECFEGKRILVVSNQVLAEFGRIALFKIEQPLSIEKVQEIVDSIMRLPSFIKVNYRCSTFSGAVHTFKSRSSYWDSLIAQTMKENGVTTIYTENVADFDGIAGIRAVNLFKKLD